MPDFQNVSIDVTAAGGIRVRHAFFHYENSDKLLVILPGSRYTGDHPLLYYLRSMGLNLGYDVLSVQYSFQAVSHNTATDTLDWARLHAEVNVALGHVLDRNYRRICIAGKSLGTPLAVTQAQKNPAPQTSLLLLTPILDAVQQAGDMLTLAVIGTADSGYKADAVAADSSRENVTWRVFEGLNHSLEVPGDWAASLQALHQVIAVCETFLQ